MNEILIDCNKCGVQCLMPIRKDFIKSLHDHNWKHEHNPETEEIYYLCPECVSSNMKNERDQLIMRASKPSLQTDSEPILNVNTFCYDHNGKIVTNPVSINSEGVPVLREKRKDMKTEMRIKSYITNIITAIDRRLYICRKEKREDFAKEIIIDLKILESETEDVSISVNMERSHILQECFAQIVSSINLIPIEECDLRVPLLIELTTCNVKIITKILEQSLRN